MEKVSIREYTPADREIVEKCIFELQEEEVIRQPEYWQTPEKALEDKYLDYLLKLVSSSNGKLLVAEIDSTVVGYVAVAIEDGKDSSPCIKIKRIGYIPDFVVLREYQKQGIGKKLLDAAEQYIKSQGCEYVSLDVTTGNSAIDFYKKLGYKEYSTNLKKKIS
jgi:ribosomal protein S18 acetylase RimI-like enzyme